MNLNDILILAKAGFTQAQIIALASVPAPAQVPAPVPVPAQVPAQVPAPVPVQVPAPVPAQVPAQVPAPVPVQVPAQVPAPVPATDPVLQQLQQLTGLIQGSNIINSQQPAQQTTEDIIASIINPPKKE